MECKREDMNKQEIMDKLAEMGVNTDNVYPKSSFIYDDIPCIGLYKREMVKDFYFYNKFDKKIYVLKYNPAPDPMYKYDEDIEKYMVPLTECEVFWEDVPYVEPKDSAFKDMTLRQYACIHLRIPNSGLDWLDNLIKQTTPL
jgi:hypothetical protein